MIYFLTAVIVLGLVVAGIVALYNLGQSKFDNRLKTANTYLALERSRRVESDRALNKTEHVLRRIANGAGNPVLEAQIALDEISAYHEKELN